MTMKNRASRLHGADDYEKKEYGDSADDYEKIEYGDNFAWESEVGVDDGL